MEILSRDYNFHFHKATSDSNPAGTYFGEPRVEVSLIMKGSVRFIVDGRVRVVHAPCATLQAYHVDLHALSNTDQKVQTMWCHFSPDALSEEDWSVLENLPAAQPIPPLMPSLFAGALSLQQESDSRPSMMSPTICAIRSAGRSLRNISEVPSLRGERGRCRRRLSWQKRRSTVNIHDRGRLQSSQASPVPTRTTLFIFLRPISACRRCITCGREGWMRVSTCCSPPA